MKINVKLFDKNDEYGVNINRFFEEKCNGQANIVTEVITDVDMNGQTYRNIEELMSFDRYTDVYMIDISLYEFMGSLLDLNRTIILRETSNRTKISNAYIADKYQSPIELLEIINTIFDEYKVGVDKENDVRNTLVKGILNELDNDPTLTSLSNFDLRVKIADMVLLEISNMVPEYQAIAKMMQESVIGEIYSSIRGYGLLDKLLGDESITEVMINGYDNIFVERDGRIERYSEGFKSSEQLEDMIQKIVGSAGREVNQASPIVDTRLADGSRVNVVLPPIALQGPTMTIRKFSKNPMTMDTLQKYGSITPEAVEFLKKLVKARYNIFISGGTGSGKTTFLNALSDFIPKTERIITIEDSAELKIEGIENLVSMETRNANATGNGEIPMRQLIKSSLRMRPDRIIVGEVRGIEALDMLQAMNTGHDGSLSTGHANSSEDMMSRLETMILQNSDGLPLAALRRQIASSLDIIIHLSRMMDHSRKTVEISEVLGVDSSGNIGINPLFIFEGGNLVRTANQLTNKSKLEFAGITL